MFGLQPTHWLIIAIVALVFFVPSRLPELVRALKKTVSEFGGSLKEMTQDEDQEPPKSASSKK
jgi:sec-independent protein translocase protein TatA